MLRAREFACSLLLQAVWNEAEHFGGLIPMRMVGQCIGNRVRLGWGDWNQVLSNLPKYSVVPVASKPLPPMNDPRFLSMLMYADKIFENTDENLVKGGVMWADLRHLNREDSSPWFMDNVVKGKEYTKTAQNALLVIWG